MGVCYCRNCGARTIRPTGDGICEVYKRRPGIDPKNVLIATTLIVYIGASVAAYIKDHLPRKLTAEQREKVAGDQRLATHAVMMVGHID